jgi:hypothetical protein
VTPSRILFLADPAPDYVADGLLHGLRSLLGPSVVDWPKREPMYVGADLRRQYGRGFGIYGLLPDEPVDRSDVFGRPWDLVVSAVMWRDWHWWRDAWAAFGPRVRHAVVDGGDLHWIYPYGPAWWRPGRWFLPRAHTRATYFKREWGPLSTVAAARHIDLQPIAISYPAQKVLAGVPHKSQDFPAHIVDLEVGARLGRRLKHDRVYVFERESEYLADLRASRFGVTTKRAGWDALRHLEIAAAGAVPCFRRLDEKPATCAPHGLVDGENCLSYHDADHLLEQVAGVSDDERERLARGALAWARANTTERCATRFLERALEPAAPPVRSRPADREDLPLTHEELG